MPSRKGNQLKDADISIPQGPSHESEPFERRDEIPHLEGENENMELRVNGLTCAE